MRHDNAGIKGEPMKLSYELKPGRLILDLPSDAEPVTLNDFLKDFHISGKKRYELFQSHGITLNRSDASGNEVLHGKDRIVIALPVSEPDYQPAEEECSVVYEDDFVYVARKEPGIIVHDPDDPNCLASMAAAYQVNHGIQAPVRYIHRLDRETTGLVLFVKIPLLQAWYDAKLEEKEIEREYLAITGGKGHAGQKFTYNQKIGRDRHVSGKYRFSSTGKEAITKAEVLERHSDFLLIRCRLLTGRTHQIRVHLSGNRHPIINDAMYGIASSRFDHMCLWADRISFPDPFSGEIRTVQDTGNRDFELFRKL